VLSVAEVTQRRWKTITKCGELARSNRRERAGYSHSACCYAHHKSCKDWPGIKPGPPGEGLVTARPNNGATTRLQKSQKHNGAILKEKHK